MEEYNRLYNYLLDCEIYTQEEIDLAEWLEGATLETLEHLLYYRTGYRSLEQLSYYE